MPRVSPYIGMREARIARFSAVTLPPYLSNKLRMLSPHQKLMLRLVLKHPDMPTNGTAKRLEIFEILYDEFAREFIDGYDELVKRGIVIPYGKRVRLLRTRNVPEDYRFSYDLIARALERSGKAYITNNFFTGKRADHTLDYLLNEHMCQLVDDLHKQGIIIGKRKRKASQFGGLPYQSREIYLYHIETLVPRKAMPHLR